MDLELYVRAIIALIFVIGLIGVISMSLKKMTMGKISLPKNSEKRLSITEISPVDSKRYLALVKRDNVEHLVLLGMNSDLLIESNIKTEDTGNEDKE